MHDSILAGRFRSVLQTFFTVLGLTLFLLLGSKAVSQADDRAYVDGKNQKPLVASSSSVSAPPVFKAERLAFLSSVPIPEPSQAEQEVDHKPNEKIEELTFRVSTRIQQDDTHSHSQSSTKVIIKN
jgi:hypothetical protein